MWIRASIITLTGVVLISCGGGSASGESGGTVTSSLDGTWDVSALGDDPAGAGSQLVIANDSITGTLIDEDEGKDSGDGCVHTKNRATLDLKFQGNAMSGTITTFDSWTKSKSDALYCPTSDTQKPYTVTGTRSNAGAGADGDWEIAYTNKDPFIVSIAGNAAKAWDKKDKARGRDPKLTAVVVGNSATTSGDDDLSFAAKRR
jgi:hypothetical protein